MLISERQRISAFLLKILLRDVHRVVCLQMDLFQFWLVAAMFVRINTKCSQNYTNKIVFCYYEFFRQYNVNHKIFYYSSGNGFVLPYCFMFVYCNLHCCIVLAKKF